MDSLLELLGVFLARAYAFYGMVVLAIPAFVFVHLGMLLAVMWAVVSHSRGQQPWPRVPLLVRRCVRLTVEIAFGLINPLLYLAIITPSIPTMRSEAEWWFGPLTLFAWILLVAFWTLRIFGSALDQRSRYAQVVVRSLLIASIVCVLAFALKDIWLLIVSAMGTSTFSPMGLVLNVLRLCPLYLIPVFLLWDYLNSQNALFLLPDRAARAAVACVAIVALVTLFLTVHRRSDATVRKLVSDHREPIRAAAKRYDVDPKLIASIVYVTHRDQLSPFRGALERLVITAWGRNMRHELGIGPPDEVDKIGSDENPMLNRALDVSVGVAQIKPRTAQTASVLATGRRPDELPKPAFWSYRDVEPIGSAWTFPATAQASLVSPIPVPAERDAVVSALLDAESNLDTCALILALYQNQWEATNPDWSLRDRPDILATLYQIGFARSKPHGAPQSNSFGARVGQVYYQAWLGDLLDFRAHPSN